MTAHGRRCSTIDGRYREFAAASEEPIPSAVNIEIQTVETTGHGGELRYDGSTKITGRKRYNAVKTLGLLSAVAVTSASVDDAAAIAIHLIWKRIAASQHQPQFKYRLSAQSGFLDSVTPAVN